MKLRSVLLAAFLLTLPAWPIAPVAKLPPVVVAAVVKADEPKPTPAATGEQIKSLTAARIEELKKDAADQEAKLAALLKKNAATVAELKQLNGVLAALGGTPAPVPEMLAAIGKPGKPGKDGHSPVLTWVGDQLAIDGKVTGPHLTGPRGERGEKGEPGGNVDPPIPTPTANKVYMAVVRDPRQVTPEMSRLLGDTPFWDSLKAAGHEWDFYSNTAPEATTKGYLRLAEKVQTGSTFTPTLIILEVSPESGKPLTAVVLPRDKAGVLAELKKVVK